MGPDDPLISRDQVYDLAIYGNFSPLAIGVDSTLTQCAAHQPGSVVQAEYENPTTKAIDHRAYIAYPSANAIIEVSPGAVLPGTVASNVGCYR